MNNEIYVTPLAGRYPSKEMNKIWSSDSKYSTWRKLWVALAETEKELGIDITDEQINEMKENVNNIDYDVVAEKKNVDMMLWHMFMNLVQNAQKQNQ